MTTKLNGAHFRAEIKKICDLRSLNFSQLSKLANMSHSTIYTIFIREAITVQRKTALKFARGLKVDFEILGDKIYFRKSNNKLTEAAQNIAKRFEILSQKDKILIEQLLFRIEQNE